MNFTLIIDVIKSVLTLLVHTVVTVKVDIYCKATIKIVQVISKAEICNTQYTGRIFSEYLLYEARNLSAAKVYFTSSISAHVHRVNEYRHNEITSKYQNNNLIFIAHAALINIQSVYFKLFSCLIVIKYVKDALNIKS